MWEYTREQKDQNLATCINIIEAAQKKKLKIRYFSYDQKSHYAINYTKTLKN